MSGVILPLQVNNIHSLNNHLVSPAHQQSIAMTGRKRKAEDDVDRRMDQMSSSPSPSVAARQLPPNARQPKRIRTNITGRPLALPRLLETLSADEMRGVLQSLCNRHPEIGAEIIATAPRPSVTSAIHVLTSYQSALREAFPYGDRPSSEYSYNRVRQSIINLIDALKDYTPHFMPPQEPQSATSLEFLNNATNIIHELPNWDSYQHNRHKHDAYEEIARAWAVVIQEAAKKGGGIQLQYGGWDQKLAKHNDISGNKLQEALEALKSSVNWTEDNAARLSSNDSQQDPMSIRQQLMSGTYGLNAPIHVGPW